MKQLLNKGWLQVILLGIVIGGALIFLDSKFNWFGAKKPKVFHGAVDANTDEIYFTNAAFSDTEFDFGKVKEGDTVKHVFVVKNTGEEPLFIFKAQGSCDCVVAQYSGAPITAGGEEDLTVFFDTKGRKGHQQRTVTISTNTDPSETVLTITGEVE